MEWKPIKDDPQDGNFRLYGLWVKQRDSKYTWFEAHYLCRDPDQGMLDTALDSFSEWDYDDFQVYCDVPAPPDQHLDAKLALT